MRALRSPTLALQVAPLASPTWASCERPPNDACNKIRCAKSEMIQAIKCDMFRSSFSRSQIRMEMSRGEHGR